MMHMDRTKNEKEGQTVEGYIIIPDACGVYDVRDNVTGKRGALLAFECQGKKIQIVLDEENLAMMVLSLTEVQAILADANKPTDTKGFN